MVIREILLEGRRLAFVFCTDLKRPIGPNGWYSATADAAAITRLGWGPLFGVPTGKINNIVIVDVDPRNGGDETFDAELSWLPPTLTHRTKSGGRHLVYKYPAQGIKNFSGSVGRWPGIDILSDGKGAVWPPSRGYEVIDDRPMAECPTRLIAMVETLRTPLWVGKNNASLMPSNWSAPADHEVPKPLYFLAALSTSCPQHKRRVIGVLRPLVRTSRGRNKVCFNRAVCFRENFIACGIITVGAAADLLFICMELNGYVFDKERGDYRARSTIRSGLGVKDINEALFSPHPRQERDHDQ
jgi:hypothetical protein